MVAKNSVSYRKLLIFYAITEIKNLWLDVSIWQFQSAHSKCWITKAYNIKNILRILCDRNTNFALNISSYLNFKMAIFYDEKQIELPIIYFNRLKTWDFLGCGYSDCLGCDIVNSANCAHQITRVINQRLQFVCQSKLCTKIMYQNMSIGEHFMTLLIKLWNYKGYCSSRWTEGGTHFDPCSWPWLDSINFSSAVIVFTRTRHLPLF
jgi:hypothetical protein